MCTMKQIKIFLLSLCLIPPICFCFASEWKTKSEALLYLNRTVNGSLPRSPEELQSSSYGAKGEVRVNPRYQCHVSWNGGVMAGL